MQFYEFPTNFIFILETSHFYSLFHLEKCMDHLYIKQLIVRF